MRNVSFLTLVMRYQTSTLPILGCPTLAKSIAFLRQNFFHCKTLYQQIYPNITELFVFAPPPLLDKEKWRKGEGKTL